MEQREYTQLWLSFEGKGRVIVQKINTGEGKTESEEIRVCESEPKPAEMDIDVDEDKPSEFNKFIINKSGNEGEISIKLNGIDKDEKSWDFVLTKTSFSLEIKDGVKSVIILDSETTKTTKEFPDWHDWKQWIGEGDDKKISEVLKNMLIADKITYNNMKDCGIQVDCTDLENLIEYMINEIGVSDADRLRSTDFYNNIEKIEKKIARALLDHHNNE